MADRFFLLDGAYHALAEGRRLPRRAVEVPRLPGVGEAWDEAAGAFVVDDAVAADMAVPAGHIPAAHAIKAVEAALILSGVTLTHGLLAEEAAALGVDPRDLAGAVHARGQATRATEVQRRCRKAAQAAKGA